jgi:SAM-dependent methyltransferase
MRSATDTAPPLAILRCPATAEPLRRDNLRLTNLSGSRSYPVIDREIPVLVADEHSVFDSPVGPEPLISRPSRSRLRSALRRLLTDNGASRGNLQRMAADLRPSPHANGATRRVLVVGGGILGFGMDALVDCPWVELVETDVYVGPRTRVVCDAHDLPFVDGAFDGVVIQAVLEHVVDPPRVVAELYRVLGEDGLLYSEVPFMQQVHEGAHDFTRWTMTGHRRLLRDFSEIDAGPLGGTGEALAWSVRYFVLTLAGDSMRVRRLLSTLLTAATLPLRWFDRAARGRPAALDGASGTYFLGRRRAVPRPDAEIIADHLGAVPTPTR